VTLTRRSSIRGIEAGRTAHHHSQVRRTRLRFRLRLRRALRGDSRHLLDAALEIVDVAMIACAADGRVTHANRHARELLGAGCPALGSYPDTWMRELRPRTASGISLPIEDLPAVRALQGEVVRAVDMLLALPGGDLLLEAAARPAKDARGRARGAIVTLAEVSARPLPAPPARDADWVPWGSDGGSE
jgi:PAS domain-containing protein